MLSPNENQDYSYHNGHKDYYISYNITVRSLVFVAVFNMLPHAT
jgi:hypothetical protein